MRAPRRLLAGLPLLLCLAACTGASSDGSESTMDSLRGSDPTAPGNKERLDMLRARLGDLAKQGANDFAASTKTSALGEVLSTRCTGREFAELGVPSIGIDGCTFVFRNGEGTTTFDGHVSAYVILKGQPDPTVPNDPATGRPRPATEDKFLYPSASNFIVTGGLVPRFASPLPIDEEGAFNGYIAEIEAASGVSEVDLDACREIDPPQVHVDGNIVEKCFEWLGDDWYNGTTLAWFAVEGRQAVGVHWMGVTGNF